MFCDNRVFMVLFATRVIPMSMYSWLARVVKALRERWFAQSFPYCCILQGWQNEIEQTTFALCESYFCEVSYHEVWKHQDAQCLRGEAWRFSHSRSCASKGVFKWDLILEDDWRIAEWLEKRTKWFSLWGPGLNIWELHVEFAPSRWESRAQVLATQHCISHCTCSWKMRNPHPALAKVQRRSRVIVSSSIAIRIKISTLSKWRFTTDEAVQNHKDYQAAYHLRVEHFFMRPIPDRVRKTRETFAPRQACSKTSGFNVCEEASKKTKFVKHGITIVGLVVADVWRKQQTVKAIDLSWKDRLVANPRNAFPQLPTKDVEVHFICFVFSGIFTWDVVISTPVPTVLGPSNGCTSQQAGRVKSHLAWSQLMLFLWRNWWS